MINPNGESSAAQMFMADDAAPYTGGGLYARLFSVDPMRGEVNHG